ncbi:MAG: hypothetical protein RR706_09215, partial [Muribaculaceae bacterium]
SSTFSLRNAQATPRNEKICVNLCNLWEKESPTHKISVGTTHLPEAERRRRSTPLKLPITHPFFAYPER